MGGLCIVTERFDYIIRADVIDHLVEPWTSVRNMRELLSLKTVSVCAEDLDAYQYFVLARRT